MSRFRQLLALVAAGLAFVGFGFDIDTARPAVGIWDYPLIGLFQVLGVLTVIRYRFAVTFWIDGALAVFGGVGLMLALGTLQSAGLGYWLPLGAAWLFAWLFAEGLSAAIRQGKVSGRVGVVIPLMFGLAILIVWEAITVGGRVSQVLLPSPSSIGISIVESAGILAADFVQTFIYAVLIGYALGCGAAFAIAIAIDRSPFLKRGLLPLGNFVSALPLVGIAPIMVMWFGFGWESKAAVVVVMTFFPMLVNTVAGLNQSGAMERDMMRTYAASYWQTLFKLRLPAAAPFIFNALKINSTLALIGAIVAEFFGSPVVGMGFRMSSEIGKLNLDLAWAEIAMAAVAGSLFYWVVALIERAVTFWHPSVRRGRA